MTEVIALVVDFGGVLTTPLADAMQAWVALEGLDPGHVAGVLHDWIVKSYSDPVGAVSGLETGRLKSAEFEEQLAAALTREGAPPVVAKGLLDRMFADFREEAGMTAALLKARVAGVKTALLSNSWGNDYPREKWDELFDAVVISGEVGLRKPDPAIFRLVAERLGVTPAQCVFVDDLAPNVRAAVDLGMVGVHHIDVGKTLMELEAVLGVELT